MATNLPRNFLKLTITSVAFFSLIGLVYGFLATKLYRAEVLMLPESAGSSGPNSRNAGLGALASLAGVRLDSGNELRAESLATLQSRTFIGQFIDEHGIAPILYSSRWDEKNKAWSDTAPTQSELFKLFSSDVMSVREDTATGLTTLRVEWTDPALAALWANRLVESLNETMRARARDLANASISYLESEFDKTSTVGVRASISSLLETQINRIMMANVRKEYAYRVIDPAVAPDIDNPIFPKRLLLVCASAVFGLLFALGISAARLAFEPTER